VNNLLSYAISGAKAFSKFFAENAVKGQVISSMDPIEKQVNEMVLSAGLGEIDISVNHANPAFEPNFVERALHQEKNSMHATMIKNDFDVIIRLVHFCDFLQILCRFPALFVLPSCAVFFNLFI